MKPGYYILIAFFAGVLIMYLAEKNKSSIVNITSLRRGACPCPDGSVHYGVATGDCAKACAGQI